MDSKIHVGTGIGTLCLAMQRSNIPSSAVDPDPQKKNLDFCCFETPICHLSLKNDENVPDKKIKSQSNKTEGIKIFYIFVFLLMERSGSGYMKINDR